jgi:hypothetical protein
MTKINNVDQDFRRLLQIASSLGFRFEKREILFIFWNKLSNHTDGDPTKDEKLLERHLEQVAEHNFIESVGTGLQTLGS